MVTLILLAITLVVWFPRIGPAILFSIWFVGGMIITLAGLYLIIIPNLITMPIKDMIDRNSDAICMTAEAWHLKDAKPLSNCIGACMDGVHIPRICQRLYNAGTFSIDGKPGHKDVWRPGTGLVALQHKAEKNPYRD